MDHRNSTGRHCNTSNVIHWAHRLLYCYKVELINAFHHYTSLLTQQLFSSRTERESACRYVVACAKAKRLSVPDQQAHHHWTPAETGRLPQGVQASLLHPLPRVPGLLWETGQVAVWRTARLPGSECNQHVATCWCLCACSGGALHVSHDRPRSSSSTVFPQGCVKPLPCGAVNKLVGNQHWSHTELLGQHLD